MYWCQNGLCCIFILLAQKNTTTLDCWTWFKAIVLKLCFCKWLAERKTPLCGLWWDSLTVVEMVVLDIIWECDHTSNLFNLVQIMLGCDTVYCFILDISLWEFFNDSTFKRNLQVQLKWSGKIFYLLQHIVVGLIRNRNLWKTHVKPKVRKLIFKKETHLGRDPRIVRPKQKKRSKYRENTNTGSVIIPPINEWVKKSILYSVFHFVISFLSLICSSDHAMLCYAMLCTD